MRTLSFLALLVTLATVDAAETGSIAGVVRCKTQTVANAVVYLGVTNGRNGASNLPPAMLELVQGAFVPRIQVARSGAALLLKNGDATLHVVQVDVLNGTNAPVRLLTEAMPYAGYERAFALEHFREPRLLRATAGNGEEGAVAYLAVLPHSLAALTDDQGRFTIKSVPVGLAKLFVWQEVLGTLTREVRITNGGTTQVEIEFPTLPTP